MDGTPSHAFQVLHPPSRAHEEGWLDVGNGHAVHHSVAGHPGAPAALFLHGGPGAGCQDDDRRWFDPQGWRIVPVNPRYTEVLGETTTNGGPISVAVNNEGRIRLAWAEVDAGTTTTFTQAVQCAAPL